MKSNAVKNKDTISGVYCSSRSFGHVFSAILKTVHSDKGNCNKWLTVSTNHNRATHPPKLFSPLSLIQSNVYYQTKKSSFVLSPGLKTENYYRRNI